MDINTGDDLADIFLIKNSSNNMNPVLNCYGVMVVIIYRTPNQVKRSRNSYSLLYAARTLRFSFYHGMAVDVTNLRLTSFNSSSVFPPDSRQDSTYEEHLSSYGCGFAVDWGRR